ncbi:MAG: hypothetical protein BAJALOKI2v1_360031 [Promethearchaeota archaeon]|nr:MAG: hypothetical protein BAJALOKI2v1_360031 [Candidatus Lokiarchaeota archaeon]
MQMNVKTDPNYDLKNILDSSIDSRALRNILNSDKVELGGEFEHIAKLIITFESFVKKPSISTKYSHYKRDELTEEEKNTLKQELFHFYKS